ncbi:replication initiation protein RepC [Rhizobium oryzihabitans]|uniref:replication initiation protein RepC n=1 Tax=Rhizobium oryzihabitans TaxID=2267833 RepID=UPI0040371ECF
MWWGWAAIWSCVKVINATVLVRAMLGANPSGFQDVGVLLKLRTSPQLSRAFLKTAGHITPSGGYLRDLMRTAKRGEFNLGPMIMASMRAYAGPDMKTA